MVDLLLGPIVGGLNANQANLWGRATGPGQLYAWLGHQPDLADARLAGRSLPLDPADGFAGVAPLRDLQPETHYHYALTLSDAHPDPSHAPYPGFTTFPIDNTPRSFNFAFGSCFRPTGAESGQVFNALDSRRVQDNLRFVLMIGDQIYADDIDHNGLGKVACTLDEYRAVYTHNWTQPSFRKMIPNLPAFMTLDDHEVDDDWHWVNNQRLEAHLPPWDRFARWLHRRPYEERIISRQRVQNALQAYWEHQAMHGPLFIHPPMLTRSGQYTLSPDDHGSLAYTFTYGTAAFFVMDTRTQRMRNPRRYAILGHIQWELLEKWLLEVKDKYPVKFLVTSSALLFAMFTDIPADRWPGYPRERYRLLSFLARHSIRGVHILTGDLHSCHAVYAELGNPKGETIPLWEFCSSPFEQQPNWIAPLTYWRLQTRPVVRQDKKFCLARLNFGVVRVDLDDPAKPSVRFEAYDEHNQLLAQAG